MPKYLTGLLFAFLCTACIEPTTPDFQIEGPFYLVEGEITNLVGTSEIRVRKSDFRQVQLTFTDVDNATVTAEQQGGAGSQVQWDLVEGTSGTYRPPADFVAAPGQTWQVRVSFPDGTQAISAPETLPEPTQLDNLKLVFAQEGRYDDRTDQFIPLFRVLLSTSDPAQVKNYYQWDYRYWEKELVCLTCFGGRYRSGQCIPDNVIDRNKQDFDYLCEEGEDGCFRETRNGGFTFSTDQAFDGGRIVDNEIGGIPFTRLGGLLVEGQLYSITAAAYEYGKVVTDLVEGNSGLNATTPAALIGNMSRTDDGEQPILGFVRAATVATRRLYIERDVDTGQLPTPPRPLNLEPIKGAFVPPTIPCRGGGLTPITPEGWPD